MSTGIKAADKPRIAVIGCGYWGINHARTLSNLGVLAGVADIDGERALAVAEKHSSAAISLHEIAHDTEINAAVIALPADQHPDIAKRMLEAGKHVLVEKPMALTSANAAEVVVVARTQNRVLLTGHILRFHNAFRRIVSLIGEGAIGDIKHIQSHRLTFGKFHRHFDALWDLAPHDLSLVLALTGEAPSAVEGETVSMTGGQADAGHIHMTFGNGMTAHVHVSRHSPYRERRFVVTGTAGMVLWDDFADWPEKLSVHKHRVWSEGSERRCEITEPQYEQLEGNMALTDELEHFIDCIAGKDAPLTPGQQGLEVIQILEKAGQHN
ncbi:MAG: Gfo/Idh/MocA family oxidoreductase [Pseudomonadota bacterium]